MANLAVVVPVFNEGRDLVEGLQAIMGAAQNIQQHRWTLFAVDDGSSDDSVSAILEARSRNQSIELISLTRNFGKEAAIQAGLQHCLDYDAVIIIDSDLEHPPQLIPELVKAWESGYKVVNTRKTGRGTESLSRNLLTRTFFHLFNRFAAIDIENDTDFKLLDREVVLAYLSCPESSRFFRGLIRWMNYPAHEIEFEVPQRTAKNHSSWSRLALLRYAFSAVSSFTALPLQIVTLLGCMTLLLALILGSVALFNWITGVAVDGFTTVILLILLLGSILMISIGIIGIYIGKIYEEVKQRPSFFIDRAKSTKNDYDA